jgi:hypothetical protein
MSSSIIDNKNSNQINNNNNNNKSNVIAIEYNYLTVFCNAFRRDVLEREIEKTNYNILRLSDFIRRKSIEISSIQMPVFIQNFYDQALRMHNADSIRQELCGMIHMRAFAEKDLEHQKRMLEAFSNIQSVDFEMSKILSIQCGARFHLVDLFVERFNVVMREKLSALDRVLLELYGRELSETRSLETLYTQNQSITSQTTSSFKPGQEIIQTITGKRNDLIIIHNSILLARKQQDLIQESINKLISFKKTYMEN